MCVLYKLFVPEEAAIIHLTFTNELRELFAFIQAFRVEMYNNTERHKQLKPHGVSWRIARNKIELSFGDFGRMHVCVCNFESVRICKVDILEMKMSLDMCCACKNASLLGLFFRLNVCVWTQIIDRLPAFITETQTVVAMRITRINNACSFLQCRIHCVAVIYTVNIEIRFTTF